MIYLETKNITYIPEVTTNLNANPSLSKQNIQLAQQAISYTNAVLPKGAGNVVNRIVSHLDVGAMRMDAATRLYALPIMPIIPTMTLLKSLHSIGLKFSHPIRSKCHHSVGSPIKPCFSIISCKNIEFL